MIKAAICKLFGHKFRARTPAEIDGYIEQSIKSRTFCLSLVVCDRCGFDPMKLEAPKQ